jgi:hypothetical protein
MDVHVLFQIYILGELLVTNLALMILNFSVKRIDMTINAILIIIHFVAAFPMALVGLPVGFQIGLNCRLLGILETLVGGLGQSSRDILIVHFIGLAVRLICFSHMTLIL